MSISSPHLKTIEEIFRTLTTNEHGLTENEVQKRRQEYGENSLPKDEGYLQSSCGLGRYINW